MPETIRWSVEVRVDGGPSLRAAPSIIVDAYDKINVAVAAAAVADDGTPILGESTVELQPDVKDKVELIAITSTRYDAVLEYTLGVAATVDSIKLDSPQLFVGDMMSLFAADPKTLTITNGLAEPVTVSLLVGRSAG